MNERLAQALVPEWNVFIPAKQHLLMRRAVNSLVGNLRYPAAEFGVEIRQIRRLTSQ
jgi:hypothetical protein